MNAKYHCLCLALFAASFQAEAGDLTPGLWKISLQSSVALSPGWQPEPFELSQCLTENDARHPEQLLMGMGLQGATGCTFSNQQAVDNRMSFDVNCAGTLGIRGHGEVRFSATLLDGVLDVSLGEGETIAMHNQLRASYQGPCAGAASAGPVAPPVLSPEPEEAPPAE